MPVAALNVPLPWLPTDEGLDPPPAPVTGKSSSSRDAGLPNGESPPPLPPPTEAGPRYSVKDGLLLDIDGNAEEEPIASASVLVDPDEDDDGIPPGP